jgi:HSP20 family protein
MGRLVIGKKVGKVFHSSRYTLNKVIVKWGHGMKRKDSVDWKTLRRQVDDVLGSDFWTEMGEMIPPIFPRMDVYVYGDEVYVLADIPGLKAGHSLHIRLEGSQLHISGETPMLMPPQAEVLLQERYCGEFQRVIELPNRYHYHEPRALVDSGIVVIRISIDKTQSVKGEVPIHFNP